MSDEGGDPDARASVDTVVLDVDGTLVDSNYHHVIAWARAFGSVGYDVPLWRIHRSIGMGGDRLVPRLIGESADAKVGDRARDAWTQEVDQLLPEIRPLPHARDLLARLRDARVRVVLASSGKPEHTRHSMDLLDADEQVDEVTTSGDAPTKPAPDLIDKAIEEVDGSTALVVGDSVWDAEAAQRAGVRMVGVLTGGFGAAELTDAGAEEVFETIADLVESLDRLLLAAESI
ncbi:HAD family hydrolase [Nocardioides terrisoli]|uniref:HAD family hydrolase n=1 Tax=Nocardioides terrisoli TaxID=3388267 RepID=UPI00287B8CE4|nr:HAD family hydrolase [Nocardioides marmorisolisilvae]